MGGVDAGVVRTKGGPRVVCRRTGRGLRVGGRVDLEWSRGRDKGWA